MKNCLAILLAGWAIGVAVPAFAQQKDTVDPKVAREIDAFGKLAEAINKNDADGTAGNEVWETGEWSSNYRNIDSGGTGQNRGYYSAIYIREGDAWKIRMQIFNVTPPPT